MSDRDLLDEFCAEVARKYIMDLSKAAKNYEFFREQQYSLNKAKQLLVKYENLCGQNPLSDAERLFEEKDRKQIQGIIEALNGKP